MAEPGKMVPVNVDGKTIMMRQGDLAYLQSWKDLRFAPQSVINLARSYGIPLSTSFVRPETTKTGQPIPDKRPPIVFSGSAPSVKQIERAQGISDLSTQLTAQVESYNKEKGTSFDPASGFSSKAGYSYADSKGGTLLLAPEGSLPPGPSKPGAAGPVYSRADRQPPRPQIPTYDLTVFGARPTIESTSPEGSTPMVNPNLLDFSVPRRTEYTEIQPSGKMDALGKVAEYKEFEKAYESTPMLAATSGTTAMFSGFPFNIEAAKAFVGSVAGGLLGTEKSTILGLGDGTRLKELSVQKILEAKESIATDIEIYKQTGKRPGIDTPSTFVSSNIKQSLEEGVLYPAPWLIGGEVVGGTMSAVSTIPKIASLSGKIAPQVIGYASLLGKGVQYAFYGYEGYQAASLIVEGKPYEALSTSGRDIIAAASFQLGMESGLKAFAGRPKPVPQQEPTAVVETRPGYAAERYSQTFMKPVGEDRVTALDISYSVERGPTGTQLTKVDKTLLIDVAKTKTGTYEITARGMASTKNKFGLSKTLFGKTDDVLSVTVQEGSSGGYDFLIEGEKVMRPQSSMKSYIGSYGTAAEFEGGTASKLKLKEVVDTGQRSLTGSRVKTTRDITANIITSGDDETLSLIEQKVTDPRYFSQTTDDLTKDMFNFLDNPVDPSDLKTFTGTNKIKVAKSKPSSFTVEKGKILESYEIGTDTKNPLLAEKSFYESRTIPELERRSLSTGVNVKFSTPTNVAGQTSEAFKSIGIDIKQTGGTYSLTGIKQPGSGVSVKIPKTFTATEFVETGSGVKSFQQGRLLGIGKVSDVSDDVSTAILNRAGEVANKAELDDLLFMGQAFKAEADQARVAANQQNMFKIVREVARQQRIAATPEPYFFTKVRPVNLPITGMVSSSVPAKAVAPVFTQATRTVVNLQSSAQALKPMSSKVIANIQDSRQALEAMPRVFPKVTFPETKSSATEIKLPRIAQSPSNISYPKTGPQFPSNIVKIKSRSEQGSLSRSASKYSMSPASAQESSTKMRNLIKQGNSFKDAVDVTSKVASAQAEKTAMAMMTKTLQKQRFGLVWPTTFENRPITETIETPKIKIPPLDDFNGLNEPRRRRPRRRGRYETPRYSERETFLPRIGGKKFSVGLPDVVSTVLTRPKSKTVIPLGRKIFTGFERRIKKAGRNYGL